MPRLAFAALVMIFAAYPAMGSAETRLQQNAQARAGLGTLPTMPWDIQTANQAPAASPAATAMILDSDTLPRSAAPAAQPVATTLVNSPTLATQAGPVMPPSPAPTPAPSPSGQAMRMPDLPDPPRQDLRQELWQEWAEKFQLLQTENNALRDQLKRVQQDTLSDIRVDSVVAIENQTLHNRITELEQEVETLRQKKQPSAENLDKAKDTAVSPLARPHL